MSISLEEFKSKYLDKQVEFHSYGANAYNQCVDLVNAYINQCLDNSTKDYTEIIGTNAKDFKTKFDPQDFDFIENTKTPNVTPDKGDIMIWNGNVGGGVGHVALCLEATGLKFTSLDQNWSKVERVTLEDHNYTNVIGWLRPKSLKQDCTQLEKEVSDMRDSRNEWKHKSDTFEDLLKEEQKKNDEHKLHIESLQKSQSELNLQIINLNENIKALNYDLKNKGVEVNTLKQDKSSLESGNNILRDKINVLEGQIEGLQVDIVDLTTSLEKEKTKSKKKLENYTKLELLKAIFGRWI